MCKDEIFKEIGVNNKILMFLMIKDSQNTMINFLSKSLQQKFSTCYKTKIVAKNMNCNKMMIKLVSENVLAVLQRCIMINFVVKKSSTRVQYMLQDKNCC